jgi:hypothetical protein
MAKARDYKREYARYQGKPSQIKRRAKRNAARRKMVKKHGKAALHGKDVNHKKPGSLSNKASDLSIESKKRNRGFKRSSKGKNLGMRRSK